MEKSVLDLSKALASRKEQSRFRKLRSVIPLEGIYIAVDGKRLLNFSSNDYLGLSQHPFLKESAIEYTSRFGVGAGASRLLSGNNEIYEKIENQLAELKGSQSALIFSTGFQLNLAVLLALSKLADLFLCDKLCHNSLLMGASLSKIQTLRFKHNDLVDLEHRLKQYGSVSKNSWVISESVFSMDGDICPIEALEAQTNRAETCYLYIDEAHATGVFGKNGMGLSSINERSIAMGTFGKGLGSFGAYIACSQILKDYLVNFCQGLIYTTALPPSTLGAIEAALEILPSLSKERSHLLSLAEYIRDRLVAKGFNTGKSKSQIIPIIVGSDDRAVSLSQYLETAGVFAPAIRPPTVPAGTARIRLSVSALHTQEHADHLIRILEQWSPT
jgi:8-amino-7-oxononanoate synthase